MDIQTLLEKVRQDVDQYEIARKIFFKIASYFYERKQAGGQYGLDHIELEASGNLSKMSAIYFVLTSETLGLSKEFHDLIFLFGANLAARAMYAKIDEGFIKPQYTSVIFCSIRTSKLTAERVAQECGGLALNQAMIHELIHYLDDKRMKPRSVKTIDPQQDPVGYYNSPMEFNAYFNNMANRLLGVIGDMRHDPQHADDVLDLYDIPTDFYQYLDQATKDDPLIKTVLDHWNDRNQRAALKRLYQLHHHAIMMARKAASLKAQTNRT